jgi:hypothetical protein
MRSAPRLYREPSERRCVFVRDKPIFSSERMLHKDYYRKSSVEKSMVVDLKRPDTKMNCLAVNRQSQCDFDFDEVYS